MRQVKLTATSAGLTTGATQYASGDTVGTLFTFQSIGPTTTNARVISASILDKGDVLAATDIILFNSSAVTLAADNAAWTISDADAATVQGAIVLAAAESLDTGANHFTSTLTERSFWVQTDTAGKLYAGLITRSANNQFTAATDVILTLWVEIAE